jgi:hypothetical protein
LTPGRSLLGLFARVLTALGSLAACAGSAKGSAITMVSSVFFMSDLHA